MSTVIKVEDLSKQYRLGLVGRKTISHDFNRWYHRIRGKEDPYLKIGEENDRSSRGTSDYVWSLKDLNFEVKEGEVLGIIGRNGAGKSTLLKILSKVTAPTLGQVKIRGRIASLLEVGTGFHPDLSGRNNIYLNGAILGMTKKEITRKFDEIVDFAGVERYIDTPVKRYSSGMYVRLAFAVAAHLEPEILIVDEVLAVGDAEFQKKCLGKMKDVSVNEGRTVLFVSHNMEAVYKLCDSCISLKNGNLIEQGNAAAIINSYLKADNVQDEVVKVDRIERSPSMNLKKNAKIKSIRLVSYDNGNWKLKYKQPLKFEVEIEASKDLDEIEVGIGIFTMTEFEIISSLSSDHQKLLRIKKGVHSITFSFVDLHLLPGLYKVGFGLRSENGFEDFLPKVCEFEVLISGVSADEKSSTRKGIIVPNINCYIN
jgi:lipopolysaccharide transport system ATP-binding protein